ncbi:MAG TPA: HAD family hydrolase [Dehalococcoidia bacterium]|nr:HAD family hydrolase [Dehalococcoidia bacterium]
MSRLTVYFDLDGTILDVSRRYYAVYSTLLTQLGSAPLQEDEYWRLRRANAGPREFLPDLDTIGREVFAQGWLRAIESDRSLELDSPFPGVRETLRSLSKEHRLVLVTLRRSRERLLGQLRALALDVFFVKVLTTDNQGQPGDLKGRLVKRDSIGHREAIVVGDSEADVQAARHAGLPVACVCSGIRNRDFLTELAPDALIESLTQLPPLLASLPLLAAST